MILVLLGPPGSGKGTQAARLARRYQLPIVAPGELFRQAVANRSTLGAEVARYMQDGHLVPDPLTIAVMHERLAHPECERGCLLDGYPRTLAQVQALDQFLKERQRTVDGVVYFRVQPEHVVDRLSQRRVCRPCGKVYNLLSQPPAEADRCDSCGAALVVRDDDQPAAIRERLRIYEQSTAPVAAYYQRLGLLAAVDAAGPIAQVTEAIIRTLPARSKAV